MAVRTHGTAGGQAAVTRLANRVAWRSVPLGDRCRLGLARMVNAALDLWFPPTCVGCGAELADDRAAARLCEGCEHELAPTPVHRCRRCAAAAPLSVAATGACGRCRGDVIRFDATLALGDYHGPLRSAVLRMKLWRESALTQRIAQLMAGRLTAELRELQPDVVVPVPMHWTRRVIRGVNSPDALAARLSESLGIPVARHSLVRRKLTRPQGSLSPSERPLNVRRAFRLRAPRDFRGARVLLVDDILTTGATCNQATRVLRRAGAAAVIVAVVARAGRPM